MDYNEFLRRLKDIAKRGPIKSRRKGDTGIGKTLEEELGIEENNIPGPDFDIYELKARRRESSAPITLFTKSPEPKGVNRKLWEVYGYFEDEPSEEFIQKKLEDSNSHEEKEEIGPKVLRIAIIKGKPNRAGIEINISKDKISLDNPEGIEAYYELSTLKEIFERKYKPLVFVLAEVMEKDNHEYFHFNEAYLLKGFNFTSFLKLLNEGLIEIHIRIGYYRDGRYHDHGTGFRTFQEHFPKCFEKIERIL